MYGLHSPGQKCLTFYLVDSSASFYLMTPLVTAFDSAPFSTSYEVKVFPSGRATGPKHVFCVLTYCRNSNPLTSFDQYSIQSCGSCTVVVVHNELERHTDLAGKGEFSKLPDSELTVGVVSCPDSSVGSCRCNDQPELLVVRLRARKSVPERDSPV